MVGANPPPATIGPDERTGWLLVGDDGVIQAANEPAAALLGALSTATIVGRTWSSLVWIGDGATLAAAYEAFERGDEWRGVMHFQFEHERVPLAVTITSRAPGRGEAAVIGLAGATPARADAPTPAPHPPPDLEVLVESIEASTELRDAHAVGRAVLQATRAALPFEWGVVLRVYAGGPSGTPSGAEVVSVYPTGLAGIDRGAAWAPLDPSEQSLIETGEPSLTGRLTALEDDQSPLRRLPAFGMRSRLLIPLFSPGSAAVSGCVAIYRSQVLAFSPEDGLRLERFVRGLGRHLDHDVASFAVPAGAGAREPNETPERPPLTPLSGETRVESNQLGLERLADFAAGVAHELNNPLAAVLGYAQLLPQLAETEQGPALAAIEQETLRASQVARDLLAFARQQPASRRDVRVDAVVRRVLEVLAHELAEANVSVTTELGSPPAIVADEPQLEQALLHLLRNARDAMADEGGTVSVRTSSDGATVRIEVSDDGPGVPADIAPRIFEPFVSAYEDGEHQGMGLAIVHGIAGGHGGRVWYEPVSPRGARFVLELPIGVPEV